MAAPGLGATSGVSSNHKCLAPLTEIARIVCLFGDFPLTCQTHAIRVKQTAKSLPVRAPTQIRMRIDGSFRCQPEEVLLAKGQDSAENAGQSNFVDRQCRLALPAPHLLVRIRQEGV